MKKDLEEIKEIFNYHSYSSPKMTKFGNIALYAFLLLASLPFIIIAIPIILVFLIFKSCCYGIYCLSVKKKYRVPFDYFMSDENYEPPKKEKLMNLDEFKKRYMPSKLYIDEVKKDIQNKNKQKPKNERAKWKKEDYEWFAINQRWAKVTKKELPQLYLDTSERILDAINSKYTVTDVERGDGYFIFSFVGNSVTHFKIKELPQWKFGIWLFYDKKKNVIDCEWFCQLEIFIDKFKPSRSEICCQVNFPVQDFIREIIANDRDYDFCYGNEILDNIEFMVKHPWLAAYRDCASADLNIKYVTERYARHRVEKAIKQQKSFLKKNEILTNELKDEVVKRLLKKIPSNYSLHVIDRNDNEEGYTISPRYQVSITIPNNVSDEECQKFYDEYSKFIYDIQTELLKKKKYQKYLIFAEVDHNIDLITKED